MARIPKKAKLPFTLQNSRGVMCANVAGKVVAKAVRSQLVGPLAVEAGGRQHGLEHCCQVRGNHSHLHTRTRLFCILASGTCRCWGRECTGPNDAAQLAPEDLVARVHDSEQEHNSLGHAWLPGWRPLLETSIEKLPPEPTTEESMALVCSSTIANRRGCRIASMSWWP